MGTCWVKRQLYLATRSQKVNKKSVRSGMKLHLWREIISCEKLGRDVTEEDQK